MAETTKIKDHKKSEAFLCPEKSKIFLGFRASIFSNGFKTNNKIEINGEDKKWKH